MRPRRVLLVDDLVIEAESIGIGLSAATDLLLVGRYGVSDADLLTGVATLRPDLILIEVAQLGAVARSLLADLTAVRPAARLVVLTDSDDTALAVDAARCGAIAWIEKSNSLSFVIDVLRDVCRGYARWPRKHLGAVLRALRADAATAAAPAHAVRELSAREQRTLEGMRAGRSLDLLARQQTVPMATVAARQERLIRKLHDTSGPGDDTTPQAIADSSGPARIPDRPHADEGADLGNDDDSHPPRGS